MIMCITHTFPLSVKHNVNYKIKGVLIETAEERRIKQIRDIMNESDEDGERENLYFVHVPQDEALPIKELSVYTRQDRVGDILIDHLKPFFRSFSDKVDVSLLKDQSDQLFGNNAMPSTLSTEALARVADEGQVEVFSLVRPVPSNKFTSINIYLDEIGMLKRLPLNRRAGTLAKQAGFDPEPLFYGDVFVGRMSVRQPSYVESYASFCISSYFTTNLGQTFFKKHEL